MKIIQTLKNRTVLYALKMEILILSLMLNPVWAEGRSLDQAATSIVGIALSIGKAISILGILAAGIAYNIPGLQDKARAYFKGSVMGAVCTFGAAAFVKIIQNSF